MRIVICDDSTWNAELNCTPYVRQYDILQHRGCFVMPKGIPNKRYTPEFKKYVIKTMRAEYLSYSETVRRFEINNHKQIIA